MKSLVWGLVWGSWGLCPLLARRPLRLSGSTLIDPTSGAVAQIAIGLEFMASRAEAIAM